MLLRHNRSSGAPKSTRMLMRRRLEALLARGLSTPISSSTMNASDLCVQQLIDNVPYIGRSCVVSISPDALCRTPPPCHLCFRSPLIQATRKGCVSIRHAMKLSKVMPLNRAAFGFIAAVISVLNPSGDVGTAPSDRPDVPCIRQGMGSSTWSIIDHRLVLLGRRLRCRVWAVLPRLPESYPIWVCGLTLGIAAALVGLFIVPLIKGLPVAGGRTAMAFVRSFLINGFWGMAWACSSRC